MTHRRLIILLGCALTGSALAEPADWSAWRRVTRWTGYASVIVEHVTNAIVA